MSKSEERPEIAVDARPALAAAEAVGDARAMFSSDDCLLDAEAVGEMVGGKDKRWVWKMAREGRIPYVPIDQREKRFRLSSVREWIAELERTGQPPKPGTYPRRQLQQEAA